MELRIKPFPKNIYLKKGLLIKGASPLVWLQEMEFLRINLDEVQSFPIPSNEPNILYGCFLIFNEIAPSEIGKNIYFQCVEDKLFIPEYTICYPQILSEEFLSIDSKYLIMHPDFGLVRLDEEIDWLDIIQNPLEDNSKIRKASNGVKIPQNIETYTVEMDDEKILEALQQPKTEEEWMKNLPFDKKKVLEGNKKEIEKYLKYIEQHPDRIVDLGIPLDIMGNSRGDGFSKFKFGGDWLRNLFNRNNDSGKTNPWIVFLFLIAFSVGARLIIQKIKEKTDSPHNNTEIVNSSENIPVVKSKPSDPLMFESGVTEIDIKVDSLYKQKRNDLSRELIRTRHAYSANNEEVIKDHEARGGRTLEAVESDIAVTKNSMRKSKDSLKKIYSKIIEKKVEEKSETIQKKISDSIKNANNGKPADKGIVKSIWNKKQILMIDSLGRYYGTFEEPDLPVIHDSKPFNNADNFSGKKEISFGEILGLTLFMIASVGIYSFLVKRKFLDVGGENLPTGVKVLFMGILLGMLIYIFYPLIKMFGYNWFVWVIIIGVIFLLYRLFSSDKTILNSDKNE
ncbi:APC family permease [Chryseobacterium oryctis]|uniref:APC family permease n=1 Tax=Chryseobacterium oryctis TaxID=2952618 RepID=A0ABT3HJQ4_9FLAO|nr:APC family permease [Chryseobacterium oryctis]MCW3160004.1 APC family permease [Chryseobacterium oryctis]